MIGESYVSYIFASMKYTKDPDFFGMGFKIDYSPQRNIQRILIFLTRDSKLITFITNNSQSFVSHCQCDNQIT